MQTPPQENTPRFWNESLTAREEEVAFALALGRTNREIAEQLGISIKTVDTHRGHVMKKLKCRNNAELVLHLVRVGAVKP